jgi:thiazole synthase ThiGH ThiG subunit
MANFVVIGIPGDPQLYLADLGAGTISPLAPPAGSNLGIADQLRNVGATIIKGVNLAVTVGSAGDAANGRLDEAASIRLDEGPASGRLDEAPAGGRLDE